MKKNKINWDAAFSGYGADLKNARSAEMVSNRRSHVPGKWEQKPGPIFLSARSVCC